MQTDRRSFWGWGDTDPDLPESFVASFKSMVQAVFELDELPEISPPKVEDLNLRPPRFKIPAALTDFCSESAYNRAGHTYGKAFRDVMRGIYGQFDNPPDYVAYPRSEGDLQDLINFCMDQSIALVPYGGGSSVVGGVEQPDSSDYIGSISCDMCRFDQIVAVHPLSRTATVQAGIYGPALEAGLKPHGLTLRHYPQSFEFSTLGGWIATRAGGHFATLYTHIDDMVEAVRVLTPEGIFETRQLPGSGDGPDANRLMIGSEGILGIITQATMKLQTIPVFRANASVRFADEKAGIQAVRHISQAGLYPANCRLISPLESFSMGIGDGSHAVLLLGFESHDHPQQMKFERALEICKGLGGAWENKDINISDKTAKTNANVSQQWKDNFLKAPYIRDILARSGIISETFETAITWEQFDAFHKNVLSETQAAVESICSKGLVMWRFTHTYPDGPTIYYTVVAPGRPGEEINQWDAIKTKASEAIIRNGGPITHHHAVGRVHRPWYEKSRPQLYGPVLTHIKNTLDPKWILNPEILIAPQKLSSKAG
ncbi:MAG TPA: FAD-binding oxidoreductase [Desulfosalsimonadaceae bacterium]|nr:FAD-binding oxidoreductase [Desulfosalsimonadaceae bacterium]